MIGDRQLLKLKYGVDSISRGDAPSYVDEGGIRVVNQACIQHGFFDLSRVRFHSPDDTERLSGWLRLGDVLINSTGTGTLGRVALFVPPDDTPIFADGHVTVVRPKRECIDSCFLTYALSIKQDDLTVFCSEGSTNQIELSRSKLGNFTLSFPPLAEQRAIADYLDRETARIDALVAAKERVLGLLAEKRRALITRAVTQGLNPDAPTRDSGVPWLGGVPAHWRTIQLKFVSESLQTGPFGSQLHADEYIENGIPVINPAHLRGGVILPSNAVTVDDETADRLSVHRLQVGDIVFARRGELGRCGLVLDWQQGWLCGTGSLQVRLDQNLVYPDYLVQFISHTTAGDWLTTSSVGSTMDNLNTETLGELDVLVPPMDEQRAIMTHIEAETQKLDALQKMTKRTVALLKERRAALIAAAVTGRLAVGVGEGGGDAD